MSASGPPGTLPVRSGIAVRGAVPAHLATPGSAAASPTSNISTPSPVSRVRPRMSTASSNVPAVPPRSTAREVVSPTAKSPLAPAAPAPAVTSPAAAASLLPRTRKKSIPRLSAGHGSAASPAGGTSPSIPVPPLPPSTPQIRRPRISGNLDPSKGLTPRTPTAGPRRSLGAPAQPVPDLLDRLEAAGHSGRRNGHTGAEARSSLDGRTRANGNGNNNGNSDTSPRLSPAHENSTSTHTASPPRVSDSPSAPPNASAPASASASASHGDALRTAQKRAHDLELQYRLLQAEHSRCNPRLVRPMRMLRLEGIDAGIEDKLLALLLDRETLGTVVRSLSKDQRMGLLGVIAEACKPSDIQAQIEMLEKYKEMRTGVLARLDDDLCLKVLQQLPRQELLRLRLVSKRYDRLATSPKIWKALCRELEAKWDGTIDLSNYNLGDDGNWLGLFKSLWQREKHWTNGQVQSIALLSGHKNYVTSLKLSGETLISASYDDTIRVWHLAHIISNPGSVPAPTVVPAKSVSSLDYYAPEGVLVTGSHDIGRASVWRQIDGEWKVERILSGHLHGTRAVAINAQWLVSVGSDKAIVVWDWRTGTKIVRFGQQTNVCVGMNLLDNFIVTATVDGVIRTFSIAKREMLGQFKLSDMAARHPEVAEKLREVGVGALGMLNWFAAEGRFLACATKDFVIRLAWDWALPEEQAELAEGLESPTKPGFFDAGAGTAPMTPAGNRARASLGGHVTTSSPRPSSPRSPRTPQSGAATPVRATPSMGQMAARASLNLNVPDSEEPATTTNTTSRFALARWPMVVEVLDITGTERGAFEAGRVRIVTSRRVSARAGAERRVLVGTEHEEDGKAHMSLVPLGGAWDTLGRQAGLQGAAKNPMSLALDHDKLVYGCTDGSIVVASFVGTQGKTRKKVPGSQPQSRRPSTQV